MPYPIHPSGYVGLLEHSEPLQILQAITSEPLLHLRTEELAMKYIIKLRDPSNPTYTIFRHQPSPLFNTKRKVLSASEFFSLITER